jgi:hypothetical protein
VAGSEKPSSKQSSDESTQHFNILVFNKRAGDLMGHGHPRHTPHHPRATTAHSPQRTHRGGTAHSPARRPCRRPPGGRRPGGGGPAPGRDRWWSSTAAGCLAGHNLAGRIYVPWTSVCPCPLLAAHPRPVCEPRSTHHVPRYQVPVPRTKSQEGRTRTTAVRTKEGPAPAPSSIPNYIPMIHDFPLYYIASR